MSSCLMFGNCNRGWSDAYVMLVHIPEGVSKPYMDKNLHVYVKSGSDKRKVTAREELQCIFQQAF